MTPRGGGRADSSAMIQQVGGGEAEPPDRRQDSQGSPTVKEIYSLCRGQREWN